MSTKISKQKKKKTIEQATKFDTIVIPCNSNICHVLTCLKNWGEMSQTVNVSKNDHFSSA